MQCFRSNVMVFGRKSRGPDKPNPPDVELILEDLKAADYNDPVYALSTDLIGGLLHEEAEEDDLSNPNVLYRKVVEYVGTAERLNDLGEDIAQKTKSLVESHQDLKNLASEVQKRLENIKNIPSVEEVIPVLVPTLADKEENQSLQSGDQQTSQQSEGEEDLC